jgi:hypothetical protein
LRVRGVLDVLRHHTGAPGSGAPGRIRTRDPLLRRSFHAGGQPDALLIRAGLLIVWLQPNVSGFRFVLARGWHGHGDGPLLFGLGQYCVDAGLIFCQAGTPGRVGLPLAMGLRIALDPSSPPDQQSLIFGVSVPRGLPDTPDKVLKLTSRDLHLDPSLRGGPHLALVPDQTHPMNELSEPGVLARPVLPQACRATAADGDLHFDKTLAGLVDGADPGDRAGIVAEGIWRVQHAIHYLQY